MTKSSSILSVGVHEAKTRLSELLRAVAGGQEVEICRNGTAVARIVAVNPPTSRTFGHDIGRFVVPYDFDDALPPDVLAGFET
jgi:prevent-host-death family protein